MRTTLSSIFLCLALFLPTISSASSAVDGRTIAKKGNGNGAAPCASCHGRKGMGNPSTGYPYLAGLSAEYIEKQLDAFRSGSRSNPIMGPIAKKLRKAEIANAAQYYASLKNPAIKNKDLEKVSGNELGYEIVHHGKWKQGMPACVQCHGPHGNGVGKAFPPIRGQSKKYIHDQLVAWKKGKRRNDPVGLMKSVSAKLSNKEINAIASYLAKQ